MGERKKKTSDTSYRMKEFGRLERFPDFQVKSDITKFQMNTSIDNSELSKADMSAPYHPSHTTLVLMSIAKGFSE